MIFEGTKDVPKLGYFGKTVLALLLLLGVGLVESQVGRLRDQQNRVSDLHYVEPENPEF